MELLAEPDITSTETHELVSSIRDEATWLASLVENLLSLTRFDSDEVRVQTEWEVIDDVILSAVERCRKRDGFDRIQVVLPESSFMVRIDSGLIEQVLLNLIDNAIRHTPQTTQVSVSARMVGEAAEVEVRDDGPGLSDEALRHAFDRFFTGRAGTDSRRGLGLGLAICRSIVAAHGGTVRAENATTGGAVFTCSLPNAKSITDDDLTDFETESDR